MGRSASTQRQCSLMVGLWRFLVFDFCLSASIIIITEYIHICAHTHKYKVVQPMGCRVKMRPLLPRDLDHGGLHQLYTLNSWTTYLLRSCVIYATQHPRPLLNHAEDLAQGWARSQDFVDACRLNNDHFLREMPSASSRATVLGILTADITDLPIPLPHVPLPSCQGGAHINVTPADAGKVLHIGAIGGVPSQSFPSASWT